MSRHENDPKIRAIRTLRNQEAQKHTRALSSGNLKAERAAKAEVNRLGRAIEHEVRKRDKG